MPSRIYFANGKDLEVREDPDELRSRLNESSGLPVRFNVPWGAETKLVYVNPQQVAYWEQTRSLEEAEGVAFDPLT